GRYASAQELADDLCRFLEDKPVRARRPTLRERATRWARRHRPLVGAAVALLAVPRVALAVGTARLWRARGRARAALDQAQEEQRRARQVVDEMFTEVAVEWLEGEPRREGLQRKFLLKALAHYRRFARTNDTDPKIRRETARALLRVGDIQQRLGEYAQARQAYAEAGRLFERLATDSPDVPEYRADLATCANSRGILQARAGRARAAGEAFRQAVAIQEKLAGDFPAVPGYRRGLAASHLNLAVLLMETGR